ncbi:MAG: DUF1858 domain-containing protein [Candidatus Peribacteraceae bacterium]
MTRVCQKPAQGKDDAALFVQRDMCLREVLTLFPGAADIMAAYGLHCFSCMAQDAETLEEGCRMHGFSEETIEDLLEDINRTMACTPRRPMTLTITDTAARHVALIAKRGGHTGEGLEVRVDEDGAFCMEFRKIPQPDDYVIVHSAEGGIWFFASPLTLHRIGGATIDFHEGKFRLDLPD